MRVGGLVALVGLRMSGWQSVNRAELEGERVVGRKEGGRKEEGGRKGRKEKGRKRETEDEWVAVVKLFGSPYLSTSLVPSSCLTSLACGMVDACGLSRLPPSSGDPLQPSCYVSTATSRRRGHQCQVQQVIRQGERQLLNV